MCDEQADKFITLCRLDRTIGWLVKENCIRGHWGRVGYVGRNVCMENEILW